MEASATRERSTVPRNRAVGPLADPNALTALSVKPRPGQVSSTSAMAEAGRAVQRTAGNAAMAAVLRRGGGAPPVQRMQRHTYGPGGPLIGLDNNGYEYRFDHAHVRASSMRDAQGLLIGISFPTQPQDIATLTRWAQAPNRTADREFFTVRLTGDVQRPREEHRRHPAPWADRPLYVHAHAGIHTFRISVNTGTGNGLTTLSVDGETFGRILRHHQGFQEARRNTPGQDGLLMACSTGHPEATAARDMARYLHDRGSRRTWHAPTGLAAYGTSNDGYTSTVGATQTWDSQGNEIAPGMISYVP